MPKYKNFIPEHVGENATAGQCIGASFGRASICFPHNMKTDGSCESQKHFY
jgi:hypothetical protein